MGIFMCLEYRFCKSVNSNKILFEGTFFVQVLLYNEDG